MDCSRWRGNVSLQATLTVIGPIRPSGSTITAFCTHCEPRMTPELTAASNATRFSHMGVHPGNRIPIVPTIDFRARVLVMPFMFSVGYARFEMPKLFHRRVAGR